LGRRGISENVVSRYMLDTSVLIDLSKSAGTTRSTIRSWIDGGDEIGVCGIQIAEFYRGLAPDERPIWGAFFDDLLCWEVSLDATKRAGIDQYDFDRRGTTISTPDAIITAVAREQSAVLVTNNVRDFPMPGLALLAPTDSRHST
jgi:predicted nucleic acid-binding protein